MKRYIAAILIVLVVIWNLAHSQEPNLAQEAKKQLHQTMCNAYEAAELGFPLSECQKSAMLIETKRWNRGVRLTFEATEIGYDLHFIFYDGVLIQKEIVRY